MIVCLSRVAKTKKYSPFCSEFSVLCIEEVLLTVLSNFEREAPDLKTQLCDG